MLIELQFQALSRNLTNANPQKTHSMMNFRQCNENIIFRAHFQAISLLTATAPAVIKLVPRNTNRVSPSKIFTSGFTLSKPLPIWVSKGLVASGWHIRAWRSIHTTMVLGTHSIKPGRHPWPHRGWSIVARLYYKTACHVSLLQFVSLLITV